MTSSTTMYSVGNEVDLSVLLWERLDTRLESDSINHQCDQFCSVVLFQQLTTYLLANQSCVSLFVFEE